MITSRLYVLSLLLMDFVFFFRTRAQHNTLKNMINYDRCIE